MNHLPGYGEVVFEKYKRGNTVVEAVEVTLDNIFNIAYMIGGEMAFISETMESVIKITHDDGSESITVAGNYIIKDVRNTVRVCNGVVFNKVYRKIKKKKK